MSAVKISVPDHGRSAKDAPPSFSPISGNMLRNIIFVIFLACTLIGYAAAKSKTAADPTLTDLELLGKYVFFDKISSPKRMACVTCHLPETGGTGGVSGVNLHQVAITGANPHTLGNIKPPTNAYASFIETFKDCIRGGLGPLNVCGGNFWNGRAEGNENAKFPDGATKHIGVEVFLTTAGGPISTPDVTEYEIYFGPTADQALNPMPNPVEQNIDRKAVCNHVKSSKYAPLYKRAWGVDIDCSDTQQVAVQAQDVDSPEYPFDISFKRIMLAVCAWQASEDLNSFSSKRDKALATDGTFPLNGFTALENLGHDLFYNTLPVPFAPEAGANLRPFSGLPITNCSFCHTSGLRVGVAPQLLGTDPLERYTDDAYHIIGTPRNPEIPVTFDKDGDPIDPDLGIKGHAIKVPDPNYPPGFFKVPTLRNVDKRKGVGFIKAYTHNGWFKSLESIVHFYNTSFLGGPVGPNIIIPYENTTAATFGITRCPEGIVTEKDALANNCWPEPAYPGAAPVLVGNLGLTAGQEAAIVAYLKTLTDEYTPKAPNPYKK
jgi:cytochrome c peroxidase